MQVGRLRLPLTGTELVLLAWFTVMSVYRVIGPAIKGPVDFGWDAVAYTRAARALLDGGNPWTAGIPNGTFAAPPPSLLPLLPFAYLPDLAVQTIWVGLGILSAVYIFRRLHLGWWWFLFPPLLLALAAGSSAVPLLALMVWSGAGRVDVALGGAGRRNASVDGRFGGIGGAVGDAIAVVGRVYSAVPLVLLGRWRSLLVAAVAIVLTAPFLAWGTYIRDLPTINSTLAAQSGGGNSALAVPFLIPFAVVGLLLLGRRKAAWLAVPALWPNAQEYYAVIALPVAAEVPLATLAMATPLTPGVIAIGLFVQGVWDRWRARRGVPPTDAESPLSTTNEQR